MQSLNPRILIIDENVDIHNDFNKILKASATHDTVAQNPLIHIDYTIDSAYQTEDAIELVHKSKWYEKPYALAFVDISPESECNAIETIKRIWEIDYEIQMVICSANAEYSWEEIVHELGKTDKLLILKKPFDETEIRQFTFALTKKWELHQELHYQIKLLQDKIKESRLN